MQHHSGGSILGAAVRRVEDPRFVRGEGRYVGAMAAADSLCAVMVRSVVPHARLTAIEIDEALASPGVVRVYTASDFPDARMEVAAPGTTELTRRPLLASERVRFVGDLVAVVVAETEQQAVDAADLVWPDYDLIPAVANPAAARADGAPVLYPELGTNVVLSGGSKGDEDVLAGAEIVVHLALHNQRLAAIPLETNNALAIPRSDGGVDVWMGSQSVHDARNQISDALALPPEDVHVKVPDMGGGFGAKISAYPEQILCVAIALDLGRPVRWQEGRSENLLAMSHGRGQSHVVDLAARHDGTITGLRWRVTQDAGAYPLFGSYLPRLTQRMSSGPYRIPAIDFKWEAVVTNTTPIDAYRGAGRPEAALTIERLMDLLAAELGLDPAEVRRRNFIPPGEFPFVTASRERYDSGDYGSALDLALTTADYASWRVEQAARRATDAPRQIGIGISSYVEVTAPGGRQDWGRVTITPEEVSVYSGASSHGQGHETTFAQIAASMLAVPIERVRFVQGDTDTIVAGGGTMGSRSLQMAGSALHRSTAAVLDEARRVVARHHEAAVEDVVMFPDGRIGVAGVPDRALSVFEVAELADGRLSAEDRWTQDQATVPFGTHISVVEVEIETGEVTVLSHLAVDDCGVILNRMIVDGQVHGGVTQGMGQALWEDFRYDEDSNPLTTNLTTYLIPASTGVPIIRTAHTETPTDQNPLGAKGIGEAGTIGAGPAVLNAVHDALRPYGIRHLDMPLTPSKVWQALHG